MPVINKQTVKATPNRNGLSVLDRIKPVVGKVGRLKLSIYGNPKTGKTRLACSFPKPLLIIGTEDGTESIVGMKGIDFVQIENCAEFDQLVASLSSNQKYATVVVDNGTKLRDMMLLEILGVGEMPARKPWGGNALQTVWGPLATGMKASLGKLLDLPRVIPLNVVIIAQEQNLASEDDMASDVMRPMIGSALGKSVCQFVNAECSYICQTFIREQVKKKEVKNTNTVLEVKTGKKEFCLRVGPHEVYWTGFRQQIGSPELPDCIVDPSYEKIMELIQGKQK